MGCGLRVVRFHNRHYVFYKDDNSGPDRLGKQIEREIPTDPAKYQEWLTAQRKSAEEWEALYEDFLTIKPDKIGTITADLPDFMRPWFPSLLPPLTGSNNLWIESTEWIYTLDLDRQTFTVNNGAHFKLDQVPRIDWINSLADGRLGDKIALPGTVPIDAVTDLVVEQTSQSSETSELLCHLCINDVGSVFRYHRR